MAPAQNSRVSRKGEIPGNFILNWQSSANRSARPSVRRPMKACERCRTAKVKCPGDGQHGCNRCTARGLACRYTQPVPSLRPAVDDTESRSSSRRPDGTTQEETQVDLNVDPAAFNPGLDASSTDCYVMNGDLHAECSEHMDWDAVDPVINWTFSSQAQQTSPAGLEDPSQPNTTSTASSTPSAATPNSAYVPDQAFLWSRGLLPLMNRTTAGGLSWQDQLGSASCQCRAGLTLLIPSTRAALDEQQLDEVFKVTGEVIGQCQGIVDCKDCSVNCTDLICMVSVFQEADRCFEFIAKGGSDMAISVSMGSYQLRVGERDAKHWRRMLVMDLVKRANGLLGSISAVGQKMLNELSPCCRLGRVSIEYLEAVIGTCRNNLQQIVDELQDEKTTDGS